MGERTTSSCGWWFHGTLIQKGILLFARCLFLVPRIVFVDKQAIFQVRF